MAKTLVLATFDIIKLGEKAMHEHHHHHDISNKDEVLALITYMVNHNKSHTSELESLANRIDDKSAYESVMNAIENYNKGNECLANALDMLKKGE